MKHLQQMLSEDVSCKLLDLWKYESARGAGYTDAVNYANGHVILHDDTCFRFEARKDDHLTIQQLFVDKSEVAGGEQRGAFVMHQLYQIHAGRSQQTLKSALRSTQRPNPLFCVAISTLVRELQYILLLCCLIMTAFAARRHKITAISAPSLIITAKKPFLKPDLRGHLDPIAAFFDHILSMHCKETRSLSSFVQRLALGRPEFSM